jgi:hypothetical protein
LEIGCVFPAGLVQLGAVNLTTPPLMTQNDRREQPLPTHVALASDRAGTFDHDEIFPQITPGLIISTLPPARALELADALDVPPTLVPSLTPVPGPARADNPARRLLALLTDAELRVLARHVGMPTEGPFLSLYHRLALLC